MDNRQQELIKLKEYINNVDKETTLLLQNMQWDPKHLIESPVMVSCKYMAEHRVPQHSVGAHEKKCYLIQEGYSKDDVLLPDPINLNADTVVKLNKQDIMKIINTANSLDPSFKRGAGSGAAEPLSAERLQQAYSADERRAIHDAVVAAAPACHDLADLALASSGGAGGSQACRAKTRAEILSELRDMKRRRARYRVAAKTANYSDVLRDVIKTQMELYAEAKGIFIKTEYGEKNYVSLNKSTESEYNSSNIVIKQERISPDIDSHRHRASSTSTDKRRKRTEHRDRDSISNFSRDHYDRDNNSDKGKYKDISQNKYSKERREDGHSKRDTYHRSKGTGTNADNRHDRSQTEDSSTSKRVGRYDENDRKMYKYEDRNYSDSKNAGKYESSSKEPDRRSFREDYSKNSKYDDRRKYDGHKRSHRDRHREEKHSRYYDNHIKEEKHYREGSNDEKNKRQTL